MSIPRKLAGDKYFMEEFNRQTDAGKHRMVAEFKAGLRNRKTGEVHNEYKEMVAEAEKLELKEMTGGNAKSPSRPKPRPTMKNKQIKA